MKVFTTAICLTVASCSATPALAGPTYPERGRAGVVDAAGVIPDDTERALNARVVAWDRATGHQLVVATVPSLGGVPIADYGVALGRKWGLGHAGSHFASDGVILLLAPNERKVRIEVGYGLEPVLTDARSGEIIRDKVVPRLKANDIAGAMDAGATEIMATASAAATAHPASPSSGNGWVWRAILAAIGGMAGGAFIVFRRVRRRRPVTSKPAPSRAPVTPPSYPGRPFAPTPPRLTRTVGPVSGPTYGVDTYRAAPTPPPPPPAPSYDYDPPSRSSWDLGSSSSSDSSSSWGGGDTSSGFDSGGGSFGGGGSDSSY